MLGDGELPKRARLSSNGRSDLRAVSAIWVVPKQQEPIAHVPVAGCRNVKSETRRWSTAASLSQPGTIRNGHLWKEQSLMPLTLERLEG